MKYGEVARKIVAGDEAAVDQACAALDQDEDALLDAVEDAILQHGDASAPVGAPRRAAAQEWRNWGGNQLVHASALHDVAALKCAELQQLIKASARIKFVGAGHSFSDVVQTDGVLLYRSDAPYAGDVPLLEPLELATLKKAPDRMFIQLAANAKLSELNAVLQRQNLAFRNLGGAAFQTLAGAISTSTHGSGITLGALCDEVRSVLLLDAEGQFVRLEPTNGISDPVKYKAKHPRIQLTQDDSLFYAWTVSMGCMAIAVQITMEVTQAYKLRETRKASTWSTLRVELTQGKHLDARHFEVILHPYANAAGDHDCVTTTRVVVPNSTPSSNPGGRPGRWFASRRVFQRLIQHTVQNRPEHIPKLISRSLHNLLKIGEYVNDSYRVFDIGHANDIRAVSQELAFDLHTEAFEAIDAILAKVAEHRKQGIWHTGPIALRFVAASPSYLSMMNGRVTCMVELPMLQGTPRWWDSFDAYERIASEFAGRPHWGQYQTQTGVAGWLDAHYDHASKWLAALHAFDPKGRFDNTFVKRMRFRNPPTAAELEAGLLNVRVPAQLQASDLGHPDDSRVNALRDEHGANIRALAEVMVPEPVISLDELTERALQLLVRLRSPLYDNLARALGAVDHVLPLFVGGVRAFHKLPLARRQRAVQRCFEGEGIRQDLAQAIKLITLFPYYTDARVMAAIGYVPFEQRARSSTIDLTPSKYEGAR